MKDNQACEGQQKRAHKYVRMRAHKHVHMRAY